MTDEFNVELLGLTPAVNNLIKAAETLTSAAQEVSKEDKARASLADRCRANVQAYVDAMLPHTKGGSHRKKWLDAHAVTLELQNELGEKRYLPYELGYMKPGSLARAIEDAVMRRRIELDGEKVRAHLERTIGRKIPK